MNREDDMDTLDRGLAPELDPELAPELKVMLPRTRWSRRGFVMTSLATGFAAAAGPVSAEVITTDAKGLVAGEVKVPVADGEIPAYRAMPDPTSSFGGGPFPTVL